MNRKFKRTVFVMELFKNITNVFTFDQFNVSLLNTYCTQTFEQ